MKLNKVALIALIAFVLLTIGLFIINPSNREVLTQSLQLYGFSFSVMKGFVICVILAAVLPSAYFTWRYTQVMKQSRMEHKDRDTADGDLNRWELARTSFFHGNYDKALTQLEGLEKPAHVALRARILMAIGETEEAAHMLDRTFEETSHTEIGYLLAEALESNSRSPLEVLRTIVRNDPKNAVAARKKLLAYYDASGMWRECLDCIEELEKAGCEVDSTQRAAYRYEEIMARPDFTPKKALEALQRIVKDAPDFVPASLALGDAWMEQGSVEKAFKAYERSFERTHNPVFMERFESFYLEQGRPEDAIQIYRELMVRNSQPLIRFQLGKLYAKLAMTDESLEVLEPLRNSLGHIPGFLGYLAQGKSRRGRMDEALEDLQGLMEQQGLWERDYICTSCRTTYAHWQARCGKCNQWNRITLQADLVTVEPVPQNPIYY